MAKRIRVTKQDAAAPAPTGLADAAKTNAPKAKAATPTNAEGKHVMLPAFLSKTYEIFSMPEFSHVCGWNANGDTIIVSQLEAFVALVLPRFFKHRNFPSFVRQLNLYGFHKTVLDSKRLEFQHPFFKRGRPDLLHNIKRKVSSSSHHNQQLVSSSLQNSRLDAHREISDTLLREMKELRQRSDAMEKRLRELEIDNAIVRSDNLKLWKHLESAKDKQLIMQEKMKKIMWILFQIYRGKQQNLPKISSNDATGAVISEDCYINSSMLGPKEFRDVLRFLAMDEPALLPGAATNVAAATTGSRKRKFVEVPSDISTESAPYKLDVEPSSVVEVPSAVEDPNPFAMTVPSNPLPVMHQDAVQNNILSIFSPIKNSSVPSVDSTLSGFLTNGVDTLSVPSVSAPKVLTPTVSTPTPPTPTVSTPTVTTPAESQPPMEAAAATPNGATTESTGDANSNNQLAFLDEELPLLPDSDHYNFTDGEQAVMKKLEDFETSLLDEYDVSCLDTLLQQLKNSNGDKPAGVSVADPEEVVVGPTNALPHDA
ncbi:Heat shock factor protein 2 [Phytophthora cinnamomi]|uniref:Heat shock factor protein 2 n=1 Tax=Phytophthora cinnamomi TaxID=4785 RepID=UPI00355A63C4|nr:Heat shock factor protein 2 [Phytophthora cinnamomi]